MLPDFQENQKIEAQDQYGKWYVTFPLTKDHPRKRILRFVARFIAQVRGARGPSRP